jgi:hypothetical protein
MLVVSKGSYVGYKLNEEDACYSQHENSLSLSYISSSTNYVLKTHIDCGCRSVGDMPGREVVVGESEWQSLKLLIAVEDEFGGLKVEMADQPMDAAVFAIKLRASISFWRLQVGLPYVGV